MNLRYYYQRTPEGIQEAEQRKLNLTAQLRLLKQDVLESAEGQEMVRLKIHDCRERLLSINEDINHIQARLAGCSPSEIWLHEFDLQTCQDYYRLIQKQLRRWQMRETGAWHMIGGKEFDVEEIRSVPIGDLLEGQQSYTGGDRSKYLCPLHKEDTPSFVWFTKQNRYWCFGCNVGGDVIDLYQRLHDVDFMTACKQLSNT